MAMKSPGSIILLDFSSQNSGDSRLPIEVWMLYKFPGEFQQMTEAITSSTHFNWRAASPISTALTVTPNYGMIEVTLFWFLVPTKTSPCILVRRFQSLEFFLIYSCFQTKHALSLVAHPIPPSLWICSPNPFQGLDLHFFASGKGLCPRWLPDIRHPDQDTLMDELPINLFLIVVFSFVLILPEIRCIVAAIIQLNPEGRQF